MKLFTHTYSNTFQVRFSPTRQKQLKKIALQTTKAEVKFLAGKWEEGYSLFQKANQKFLKATTESPYFFSSSKTFVKSLYRKLITHFEKPFFKKLNLPKKLIIL